MTGQVVHSPNLERPSDARAAPPARQLSSPWGVNFRWLVRLRFGAVLGQMVVIAAVRLGLHIELPLGSLSVILLLELLLNVWAVLLVRRGTLIRERHVTVSVGLDLLLFSALLFFSGGPANPFSFLYLIHIALAAIVLSPRASFALVSAALACSLGLFWLNVPLPHDHARHMQEYSWHMRGMWVAFGLAACFIVYFIQRVLRELRVIEQQLAESREKASRSEAVAALAMLAAGAAHELASPLSTIAVASGELLRHVPANSDSAARDDVLLIRSQVERCREILEQLAVEAGQAQASAFGDLTWQAVLDKALSGFERARLKITTPEGEPQRVRGSLTAVSRAVRNLVSNAIDASPAGAIVRLTVESEAGGLTFTVEDQGKGMSQSVLARAREPFFTTKSPGKGLGLGLFLASSVAEQMGGRLELSARSGGGTRAKLSLPAVGSNAPVLNPVLGQQIFDSHG